MPSANLLQASAAVQKSSSPTSGMAAPQLKALTLNSLIQALTSPFRALKPCPRREVAAALMALQPQRVAPTLIPQPLSRQAQLCMCSCHCLSHTLLTRSSLGGVSMPQPTTTMSTVIIPSGTVKSPDGDSNSHTPASIETSSTMYVSLLQFLLYTTNTI